MDPLKLTEKINDEMYRLYNFAALPFYHCTKRITKKHGILKRNVGLKNIEKDSCIICGNGPSINMFDFRKANNMDIFTVNFFMNGSVNLNRIPNCPDYLVLMDNVFKEGEGAEYVENAYQAYEKTKFIVRYDMYNQMKKIDNSLSRVFFVYNKLLPYKSCINFNLDKIMTVGRGVFSTAIQAAIYMGYKKIFLIGCEHTIVGKFMRFYEKDSNQEKPQKPTSFGLYTGYYLFRFYDSIRKYADENGIEIINMTPDSTISSFEEKTMDEIYKEWEDNE